MFPGKNKKAAPFLPKLKEWKIVWYPELLIVSRTDAGLPNLGQTGMRWKGVGGIWLLIKMQLKRKAVLACRIVFLHTVLKKTQVKQISEDILMINFVSRTVKITASINCFTDVTKNYTFEIIYIQMGYFRLFFPKFISLGHF